MAFLDNSGDIILDAVLTDLGRKRLAAGRFNIYKFALGDEEINYELWNSSDNRGSAFYDLEILQTPILEAFTSDQSLMKSRLLSFARNDLLYMPILKVNNRDLADGGNHKPFDATTNSFRLIADSVTHTRNGQVGEADNATPDGYLLGYPGADIANQTTKYIAIDQGIDSLDSGRTTITPMDPDLLETAFIVKCDNRLLRINTAAGRDGVATGRTPQYVDDDYVASYYFVQGQVGQAIRPAPSEAVAGEGAFRLRADLQPSQVNQEAINTANNHEVFQGSLGRTLQISPVVRTELQTSTSIFTELGREVSDSTFAYRGGNISVFHAIDTTITVQGLTTGYSIDIPIKIIKGKTFPA